MLSRQLRRYNIDEASIPKNLLKAISQAYTEFETREDKLNSIIEISNEVLSIKNKQVNEILESLPGYVSWVDSNLNYLGMNKNLEILLGIEKKNLLGQRLGFDINNKDDYFVTLVENFFKSDKMNDNFEYLSKYGTEEKYFHVYLQRILGGDNIIINSIDVTEKVLLQNQVVAEAETKLHKERLVLLGEMAAGVAHEINNPMTVVLGQGQAILKKYKDRTATLTIEEMNDCIQRIEKIVSMSHRISRIVQSLKLLSRDTDSDDFQLENLDKVITPALDLSTDKLKYHEVEFSINQFENIQVKCKAGELTQVIYNFINNSIEAIKDLKDKWIKINVAVTKDYYEIRVTDSGPGIPPEIQAKLFFPFFTTKAVGEGTGIGLSISKKIVENHNGEIYIDNTSPNTCFVINIKI